MSEQDRQGTIPTFEEGPVSNEWRSELCSEWIRRTKSDITECNEILRRMIASCDRIGADLKDIKRMVMGDEA